MTRDEATAAITAALAAAGPIDNVISAAGFAQRLATSLDALGLLVYAADAAKEIEEHVNRAAKAQRSDDPLDAAQSHETPPWATQRQRT